MKKTLVALAALAATAAFAQSTVTISGVAKAGVAQTKYSGPTAGNGSGLSISDGSSQFHIKGSEDLGGGLKANFQIDTRFRIDDNGSAPTSNPVGTGNTFVGLSGNFGSVQLGKLDTHYGMGADTHGSRATALQASSIALLSYVGGATAGVPAGTAAGATQAIANASRSTNMFRYTTPAFSGFTGQFNYSTAFTGSEGNVGATGKGRAMHGSLNYNQGPLRAGVSVWDAESESRVAGAARADQRAYTLFGNYNFGMGTVGLTYDNSEINRGVVGGVTGETNRRAWSVPVTVTMGSGTILFTYTKADDGKLDGVTQANTGASLVSVGYDYALSKRTSVGVSYARLNNDSGGGYNLYTQAALNGTANNAVGQDASQFYAGIRHAF